MSWSSRLKNSGHHHSNYDGRPKSGKINFLLWFLIWNVQFDIERNKFKIGFSKGFFCEWEWIIFRMNDIAVVQVFLRIVLELKLEPYIFAQYFEILSGTTLKNFPQVKHIFKLSVGFLQNSDFSREFRHIASLGWISNKTPWNLL